MSHSQCQQRMGAVLILATCSLCITTTQVVAGAGSHTVTATLTKISEVRQADFEKNKDKNSFDMNPPKLELHFDLTIPKGKTIASVEQPEKITAKDSMNKDLSQVKPQFSSSATFVVLTNVYNESPKAMTLELLPANRSATRFNLDTTFNVLVYEDIKETTITPSTEGTDLDTKLFGDGKISVKLEKTRQGVNLTFVPGTVKNLIESVTLMDGGTKLDSMGSMWNDSSVAYMFSGDFKSTLKAKVKVRVGSESYPCHIEIKDQPLP